MSCQKQSRGGQTSNELTFEMKQEHSHIPDSKQYYAKTYENRLIDEREMQTQIMSLAYH